MWNHKHIVGFEYSKEGGEWHLSKQIIDAEVADVIGWESFREIPVAQSITPPQHSHLLRLMNALEKKKLDGGSIHETSSEDFYRVEVEVLPRVEKSRRKVEDFEVQAASAVAG